MKSGVDSLFGSSGDKELGVGHLFDVAREYRWDGKGRFLIVALVEDIDNDQRRDVGGVERANDGFLYLRTKGFSFDVRTRRRNWKQLLSQARIAVNELESEGRGNSPELLLSSESREQKKLAPSFPSAELISTNVWAMVDFPVLVRPLSQDICLSFSSFNQHSSWERISLLVPSMHPCLFPQKYSASVARYIPPRRVRSTLLCLRVSTRRQMFEEQDSR